MANGFDNRADSPLDPSQLGRITDVEAQRLLKSGLPRESVADLIKGRAALAAENEQRQQEEQRQANIQQVEAEFEVEQQPVQRPTPPAQSPGAEDFEVEDPVRIFSVNDLANSERFSLENYIAENRDALQDPERVAKLAEVYRTRGKNNKITAGDVAIGVAKLPVSTTKALWNLTKGTGQLLYDVVAPIATDVATSPVLNPIGRFAAVGLIGGEDVAEQIKGDAEKNLLSDLAGMEKGTFDFMDWVRRSASRTVPEKLGLRDWDELTEEQVQSEFRTDMENYLQSLEIEKGKGGFTQLIGSHTLDEIEARGEELDQDRIATMTQADLPGFLAFGAAFRTVGAAARGAKTVAGKTKAIQQGRELAAVRQDLKKVIAEHPAGTPARTLAEDMLAGTTQIGTKAAARASRLFELGRSANELLNARVRLRTAQEAARRFPNPDTQARVAAAQQAVSQAQQVASQSFGANSLSKLQAGLDRVVGPQAFQTAGQQAVGVGFRAAGFGARAAGRAIQATPNVVLGGAAIGQLFAGNFVGALATIGAGNLLKRGATRLFNRAGQIPRKVGEKLGETGRGVQGVARTSFQQGIQGLSRGSAEVVREALKAVPIDVGFGLLLSEDAEQMQNMPAFGAAFRALGASGRPLGRFVQSVRAGQRGIPPGAALPRRAGNLSLAESASTQNRRALSPEQQTSIAATESFLRGAGVESPTYVINNTQFREILTEQFQRRNNRPPTAKEAVSIEAQANAKGAFMEEVIGDNGQPGSALFITEPRAGAHEGAHAFQHVLGERGNQFVDELIFQEFQPQWEAIGQDYAQRLGRKGPTWREAIDPIIPAEIKAEHGPRAADVYMAREIAAEQFGTLFETTGGQPGKGGFIPTLAGVVDRVGKFFGVDFMQGAETADLGLPVSIGVQGALQRQIRGRAAEVEASRAATPTGAAPARPGATPPVIPQRGAPRRPTAPELRPTGREEGFIAPTPEALNIAAAKEFAAQSNNPEIQRTVDVISTALQRRPGEAVVFEAENLSVVPSTKEAAFQRSLRRAEQAVPDAVREFFRKRFAVTRFLRDRFSGDNLQLATMAMDKVLANTVNLMDRLKKANSTDLVPYETREGNLTEVGWNTLIEDMMAYTRNQANGFRGGGKELLLPAEVEQLGIAIPEQNPNFRPRQLPDNVEQFMNVIMGVNIPKTAREFKGQIPGNIKGQAIRQAQGEAVFEPAGARRGRQEFKSFPGQRVQEVNPLRAQMIERGVNVGELLEVTQRLNIDRVRGVQERPEIQFDLPVTDVLRAGFLPAEVPAGKVRLFRGQPGTGEAAGVWWTKNPEKAASFAEGGEVFAIDVPPKVAELGKSMAEAIGQGGDTFVLPSGLERAAARVKVERPTFDLDLQFLPAKDPSQRHVRAAAIRLSDGTIIEGPSHLQAFLEAERIGRGTEAESVMAMPENRGFVDSEGSFLSRAQAFELAESIGQTPRNLRPVSDVAREGELESSQFQQARQFLPGERRVPTAEEIQVANRTARAAGSVGTQPTKTTKSVLERVAPDESVLDFGAGPQARQSEILRERGFQNVTAHEFGDNIRDGVHDPNALSRTYDTVFASNVLNVQSSLPMLEGTLQQIASATNPNGRAIFNYPKAPRKMKTPLTPDELRAEISKHFGEVNRVGGTKSEPVFEATEPIQER